MGNEPVRKYFRCSVDESGPKFFCNHENKHYTIRFAGRPMLILEHFYVKTGGSREEFMEVYNLARERKDVSGYPGAKERLKEAAEMADVVVSALKDVALSGKSPIVMYVSDYDEQKVPKHLESDERV